MVGLDAHQQPAWVVETKWSDWFVSRPQDLGSLLTFCETNRLPRATVTTRTARATLTVSRVTLEFIPAALYCYAAGRSRIERPDRAGRAPLFSPQLIPSPGRNQSARRLSAALVHVDRRVSRAGRPRARDRGGAALERGARILAAMRGTAPTAYPADLADPAAALAAAQVGRGQALAGAAPPAAVERPRAGAAGRAVLRRPGRRARAPAGSRATQRRQPARHQLLPLAEARAHDQRADGERAEAYYAYRTQFNALLAAGPHATGRGRVALLLSEPDRLQRPVPLQQPRRVQRALRPVRPHPLRARLHAYRRAFAGWELRAGTSRRSRCGRTTSSTPIRPTTSRSRSTRGCAFSWDDQVRAAEWLARHPGPVVLVNQATPRISRSTGARLPPAVPRRAAPDQLHRRPHPRPRSPRDTESLNGRLGSESNRRPRRFDSDPNRGVGHPESPIPNPRPPIPSLCRLNSAAASSGMSSSWCPTRL